MKTVWVDIGPDNHCDSIAEGGREIVEAAISLTARLLPADISAFAWRLELARASYHFRFFSTIILHSRVIFFEVNPNLPECLVLCFIGCNAKAQPDRKLSALKLKREDVVRGGYGDL